MTQILIKAVNLFPAGTQKRWDDECLTIIVHGYRYFYSSHLPFRWEVIAAYVNQHSKGAEVTGKEALKQAKRVNEDCKYFCLF